jgi:hypothetical protein
MLEKNQRKNFIDYKERYLLPSRKRITQQNIYHVLPHLKEIIQQLTKVIGIEGRA